MKNSRFLFAFLCSASLFAQAAFADRIAVPAVSSGAKTSDDVKAAQIAADLWVTTLDQEQYGKVWDNYCPSMKKQTKRSDLETMLKNVRSPLGKVEKRTLKHAVSHEPAGAPDGKYVVVEYNTSFTNKKDTIEIVTVMHHQGDTWNVSGYRIK